MKNQISAFIFFSILIISCKKKNLEINISTNNPTVLFVSTDARLLDTAAFIGKRYMHFFITFDVVAGDSDLYFSQLPVDYEPHVQFLGPGRVYNYTPYRPWVLTNLPEIVPEEGVYKITAHDTVRIEYFGMIIAHGRWTQFYMQAYGFPYSLGQNDGSYESSITLNNDYKTSFPH